MTRGTYLRKDVSIATWQFADLANLAHLGELKPTIMAMFPMPAPRPFDRENLKYLCDARIEGVATEIY